MMRVLASWIMRGRMQAVLAVVGLMGLSLAFPLFSYFSAAAIALVTLRLGWREGAWVASVALVGAALIAWITLGDFVIGITFGAVVWVPSIALAWVLRRTMSLPVTLASAALAGAVGVIAVHMWVDDPAAWWRSGVIAVLQAEVIDRAGLDDEQTDIWRNALDQMALVMTGIVAAAVVFSNILSLLLARWWQSELYNPGGFRQEFYSLRLGKGLALAALALLVASLLPLEQVASVSKDIAMVLLLVYMVQGLAVVHASVAARKAGIAWLIALYVLLLLALPQMVLLLALAGLTDTWMDLRSRVRPKSG